MKHPRQGSYVPGSLKSSGGGVLPSTSLKDVSREGFSPSSFLCAVFRGVSGEKASLRSRSRAAPCVCAGRWCWLKEGTTVSGGEAVPVGGAGMLGKCLEAVVVSRLHSGPM